MEPHQVIERIEKNLVGKFGTGQCYFCHRFLAYRGVTCVDAAVLLSGDRSLYDATKITCPISNSIRLAELICKQCSSSNSFVPRADEDKLRGCIYSGHKTLSVYDNFFLNEEECNMIRSRRSYVGVFEPISMITSRYADSRLYPHSTLADVPIFDSALPSAPLKPPSEHIILSNHVPVGASAIEQMTLLPPSPSILPRPVIPNRHTILYSAFDSLTTTLSVPTRANLFKCFLLFFCAAVMFFGPVVWTTWIQPLFHPHLTTPTVYGCVFENDTLIDFGISWSHGRKHQVCDETISLLYTRNCHKFGLTPDEFALVAKLCEAKYDIKALLWRCVDSDIYIITLGVPKLQCHDYPALG